MVQPGYNKFQWMVFSADRLQQWVVRADTEEDFTTGVQFVQKLVAETYAASSTEQNMEPSHEREPEISLDVCQIHNKSMRRRETRQGHVYYDHRWKQGDVWHICNGKQTKVQEAAK